RSAGLQLARSLGVFDHRQRDAVLDGAARVRPLRLHPDLGAVAEQPVDPDVRGIADRLEDIAGLHPTLSSNGASRKSGGSKSFASRNSGNHQDHSNTTSTAPKPPAITAVTGPMSAPRKPDSASPSSLEAEMKSEETAPTRPRIASGV